MNNHLGYSRLLPNDIFPGSLVYIYIFIWIFDETVALNIANDGKMLTYDEFPAVQCIMDFDVGL